MLLLEDFIVLARCRDVEWEANEACNPKVFKDKVVISPLPRSFFAHRESTVRPDVAHTELKAYLHIWQFYRSLRSGSLSSGQGSNCSNSRQRNLSIRVGQRC